MNILKAYIDKFLIKNDPIKCGQIPNNHDFFSKIFPDRFSLFGWQNYLFIYLINEPVPQPLNQ